MKSWIVILSFLATAGAQAQCTEWKWPEDKATAQENNVLYTDAVRNSNFKAAVAPHRWLLQNAPDLNTSIYIHGAQIFSGLAEAEKDPAKRQEWIDSLMLIYDMRMQYCGEAEEVLNRKAYDAYKYMIRDKEKLPELLSLYDSIFEKNAGNIDYYITLPYMSIIYYNVRFHKNLSEEQILERYDNLMSVINDLIKKGKQVEKLNEFKSKIDAYLVDIVNVDCDFVRENLAPSFKANPEDLDLAKKIFGFMLAGKCTEDPLWLEAAKVIQEKEPEFGLAKNIAIKCVVSGDIACAEKYFQQALTLTENPGDKADVYISMGKMKEDEGSFSGARDFYRKALEVDPTKKEAYRNIGLLYYNSFNRCKQEVDPVKDRSIFIAAHEMFQKSGDTKLAQNAKEQFPSKDDIFTFNYERGGTINTGCWIGENVVIQARDE